MPDEAEDLREVASWIRAARRITVLTGAGISTESGIPDFRGPQGVWTKNPGAEKTANLQYYMSDPDIRKRSWQNRLSSEMWRAEPNSGHRALADLERKAALHTLVTQNIDRLPGGRAPRGRLECGCAAGGDERAGHALRWRRRRDVQRGARHRAPGARHASLSAEREPSYFASAAATAAPTIPASLSSCAGTIGALVLRNPKNFGAFLLTPPPMMNRSGQNSISRWRMYSSGRLPHFFQLNLLVSRTISH